jgi:hypothetical protein
MKTVIGKVLPQSVPHGLARELVSERQVFGQRPIETIRHPHKPQLLQKSDSGSILWLYIRRQLEYALVWQSRD